MTVDELLNIPQLSQTSENTWKVDGLVIPKTWGQGRTAFGGISAGMLYTAVKQQVTDNRVLRSFTTNFVGPLSLEMPFSIEVTLLRTGKNVSQFTAHAIQDGKSCVFSQACFGVARQSGIQVENTDTHDMPQPNKAKFIPQIPKVTPKFLRYFDLAIEDGGTSGGGGEAVPFGVLGEKAGTGVPRAGQSGRAMTEGQPSTDRVRRTTPQFH